MVVNICICLNIYGGELVPVHVPLLSGGSSNINGCSINDIIRKSNFCIVIPKQVVITVTE